ncbi:hypothetical protein [Streptomyces sp. NPDC047868]|uniref:hypothetical protein n=1 Tax=Streptomyces sp. NPDC047868 TaxID=3155480 RepID=UPI003455582E
MTEINPHNGQNPTDPAALATALLTLCTLLSLLTPDQRESLALAAGFLPLVIPYLPRGGR